VKEKRNKILYVALWALILIVIVWLIVDHFSGKNDVGNDALTTEAAEESRTQVVEVEKLVEVEKTITAEVLQDGLNDMGVLITEEYYFTQVESYEKTKTILNFFTSNSNFIYSYDGVVSAGIDCSGISVEKDDDNQVITITVPPSEICYIDIDHDSFQMYSEKEGLWNSMSMEDYNDSLVEFEDAARKNAIQKGVLDKADENARTIIGNFVMGMIEDSNYTIEWK
jgi:hypothetical protein